MTLWAVLCMQLQYTRSRESCHCENILLMHVYLLEWAGFNFSLRFVTPLKVRGRGATIFYRCKVGFASSFTNLVLRS